MGSGLGASLVDGKWKQMLRPEAIKEVDPLVTFEHLKGLSPLEVLQLVEPFFETGARKLGRWRARPATRDVPLTACFARARGGVALSSSTPLLHGRMDVLLGHFRC
eukprot:scaffold14900_cov103-Isochrysis_galbana.AAC.9